ncbi:AraC family transcriptional regulator [Pedobacter sp. AW1-32]|uniref:AraC family transcriptional regulator n=1 Tax=Pedobacter sp. AW1-32 TaxID=3383026 RepID=UPI003FF07DAA
MKRTQFDPLMIHDFVEKTFHLPIHSHTYYELIYIHKGSGIHHLNHNQIPYRSGDLFVISPEDLHNFEIKKCTRFTFIKFTDSYFKDHKLNSPDAFLLSSPEDIMRNKLLKEVKLKMDEPCVSILRSTIENIVAYNCRRDIATSPLMYYLILSVFGLIKEAVSKFDLQVPFNRLDREDMISYIHQNIYNPQKIQVKNIATRFNIAETYFSRYFKHNFEVSYREYINEYRTKLIEKRILLATHTLKEIAAEFGFTDESHLSNFFKTRRKLSPVNFRQLVTTDQIL